MYIHTTCTTCITCSTTCTYYRYTCIVVQYCKQMFCNVFVEVDDACKGLTYHYDTIIINYIL